VSQTVSTIIVNYNAGDLLRQCVESVLNCELVVEIIVVDNASSDKSLEGVADLPRVKIIKNPINMGFASACNSGLAAANSNYLLFLNPDCILQANAVKTLVKTLSLSDSVGMVGGLLKNPDGTEQEGCRRAVPTPWRSFVRAFGLYRFANRWPRLFYDFHLHNEDMPNQATEVEAISGACMLVNRTVIEKVGLWDEEYFLHCEDLDWCMRFRQRGFKILFEPNAVVEHTQGACGRSRPVFVEWNKHKGMCRFYCKFFRHQYPGVLMGVVLVGVWFRFGFIATTHLFRRFGLSQEKRRV